MWTLSRMFDTSFQLKIILRRKQRNLKIEQTMYANWDQMPKHGRRYNSHPANRWMNSGQVTGQVWEVIVNLHCSRFSDTQSIYAIRSKAESLPHIQGGTRTDRALELAAEDFFGWEDSGDRPDKPNVLVVLTDGDTNEGSKPFSQVMPPLNVSSNQQTFPFHRFSIEAFVSKKHSNILKSTRAQHKSKIKYNKNAPKMGTKVPI